MLSPQLHRPWFYLWAVFFCGWALPALAFDGASLAQVANCAYCHGQPKAPEQGLSGGRSFETWFGPLSAPNITPDPINGIGGFTRAQFRDALRHGRAPSGLRYRAIFPTDSYAGMSDRDVDALYDYIMAQPPVTSAPQALGNGPWIDLRRILALIDRWRLGAPAPAYNPPADLDLRLGSYVVEVLGHCGQCHTPRDQWGQLDVTRPLAGSTRPLYGGGKAPNITPDLKTGIGAWSVDDLAGYLKTGETPEFSEAKGSMADYIHGGLQALSDSDRVAVATYLLSLKPLPSAIPRK